MRESPQNVNHIVIKDDTMKLLLNVKTQEQKKEFFNVTNDVVIRRALQSYTERNR